MAAMLPSLFAFWISKDIDWTDDHNVLVLRVLFGVSVAIQALLGWWAQQRVLARNDTTQLVLTAAQAPTGTAAGPMTVRDYDLAQCKAYLWSIVTNSGMMVFFHLQFKAAIPIYFQIFMGLIRVWEWEMFRIHLWGETDTEFPQLKRPFPVAPNPFAGLMKSFTGSGDEEEAAAGNAVAATPAAGANAAAPRVEVLDDDEVVDEPALAKKQTKAGKKKTQ